MVTALRKKMQGKETESPDRGASHSLLGDLAACPPMCSCCIAVSAAAGAQHFFACLGVEFFSELGEILLWEYGPEKLQNVFLKDQQTHLPLSECSLNVYTNLWYFR